MKTHQNSKNSVLALIIFLLGISVTSFSQAGIKLQYKYPAGKTIKYVSDTKVVQDMDVNGQNMQVNIGRSLGCQVKAAGNVSENVKLEIKIDSMRQSIESPQGSTGGKIEDVKDKSFNMVISPGGKIVDLSDAAKIKYTVEGAGEISLDQEFLNYFPALPTNPIKPGDTWVTNDSVNTKTAVNTIFMPVESKFKYVGMETVDGIECARITADLSGTRKQITQSQGMEIHISGPFTGTQTLLFAVKDGYFLKQSVTTKMTGNIEIPAQNMTFPVVMNVNSTNEIVK
jgi:hypothetical protein